jgi:CRISPR-associated protein Csm1
MEKAEAYHDAALASLLTVLSKFDHTLDTHVPFALPELHDIPSRAGSLASGGKSLASFGSMPLQSVFSLLQIQGQEVPADTASYLPLKVLTLQANAQSEAPIFPVEVENLEHGVKERLDAVAKEMAELQAVHSVETDIESYLESLMLVLQRELWCVPCGMKGASLFDYARSTAALTVCLFKKEASSPVAVLVGGDISGIQNFIYTITSRGAASALRGRSLYLQLLTDAIARYVLRELNLPITNLIFAGGGHFFILARPEPDLKTIRKKISRILLSLHGGELYLALEAVPLEERDLVGKALSTKWSELSARLRKAKLCKFSELEDSLFDLVFKPRRDEGNAQKECAVCGREHLGTAMKQGRNICPQCDSYERLGRDLREAQYLRISQIQEIDIDDNAPPGDVQTALAYFGMRAKLYDSLQEMNEDSKALQGVSRSVIYALRDEARSGLKYGVHAAVGRRFLVNITPTIRDEGERDRLHAAGIPKEELPGPGDVKPFNGLELESQGIKRLGVLRMDVDSMGEIMSEGLGDQANLARIANLSFMINLFFEGWAAELARTYNRDGGAQTDSIYSIYSGGDDLFFVGAWDRIPELAIKIRNDLSKFACNHPGIHASAGIALVGGKFPLYQSAEAAHEALEKSKAVSKTKDHAGKNSITFLGQTVTWERFTNEIKPLVDQLRPLVESKAVPHSLVQRLQQFQITFHEKQQEALLRGEAENKKGEEQVVWGPWNWHAAYFLTKARSRLREDDKDAKAVITKIHDRLGDDQFRAVEWIGLAARWVDLLTR